jgi:hypothetical protein
MSSSLSKINMDINYLKGIENMTADETCKLIDQIFEEAEKIPEYFLCPPKCEAFTILRMMEETREDSTLSIKITTRLNHRTKVVCESNTKDNFKTVTRHTAMYLDYVSPIKYNEFDKRWVVDEERLSTLNALYEILDDAFDLLIDKPDFFPCNPRFAAYIVIRQMGTSANLVLTKKKKNKGMKLICDGKTPNFKLSDVSVLESYLTIGTF